MKRTFVSVIYLLILGISIGAITICGVLNVPVILKMDVLLGVEYHKVIELDFAYIKDLLSG